MSLFKEKLQLGIEEAEFNASRALSGFPSIFKWIFVLLFIALIPSYFVVKSLSYHYWQTKLAPLKFVSKPSFENPQNLQISSANLVSYLDGSFGAVVEITNPNKDLSTNITYSWRYYSLSGQILQPLNSEAVGGDTFVLPSSKKYIVAAKIITQEPISRAEVILNQPVKWQKKLGLLPALLSVSEANFSQQLSPLLFSVSSVVYNNSPYQIKQIRLSFLVYNPQGQLIAVSQRFENDLSPNEHRAFKQLWPNLYANAGRAEVIAETNLLDPNNLLLPKNLNNASDLSRPKN